MWTIVIFIKENTVEVVPNSWLLSPRACYWPPDKTQALNTKIMTCEDPDDSWKIFSIRFPNDKQQNYSEYIRARKACKKAEDQSSDLTDLEGMDTKRKTKKKILSSSEEDEHEDQYSLPICPKLPQKKAASTLHSLVGKGNHDANSVANYASDSTNSYSSEKLGGPISTTSTTAIINQKVVDLLLNLTSEVAKISIKLDYLQQDLTRLRENKTNNQQVPPKDNWENFPLNNLDELTNFERLLEEKEKRSSLVEYIKLIGGYHLAEITQRSMSRVLTNELATQYSLVGKKGKRAFINLGLFSVLQEAILWNGLRIKKETTEKDVQKAMADWLRHSKERQERSTKKNTT